MVFEPKCPFLELFFYFKIGQEHVFYDILERNNAILGYKKRSSKSRKIAIFSNWLTHVFGLKMIIFPTFFFQAKQARKMSFTIFQNEKTAFQAIKTRSSKSQKIAIFPKMLILGFGPEMSIVLTFYLGNIGQENVFYDILERKHAFLGYKNRTLKTSKN